MDQNTPSRNACQIPIDSVGKKPQKLQYTIRTTEKQNIKITHAGLQDRSHLGHLQGQNIKDLDYHVH